MSNLYIFKYIFDIVNSYKIYELFQLFITINIYTNITYQDHAIIIFKQNNNVNNNLCK